jgi:hypothetical protein
MMKCIYVKSLAPLRAALLVAGVFAAHATAVDAQVRASSDDLKAQQLAGYITRALMLRGVRAPSGRISASSATFWHNYISVTPKCGSDGRRYFYVDWIQASIGAHFVIRCGSLPLYDSGSASGKP